MESHRISSVAWKLLICDDAMWLSAARWFGSGEKRQPRLMQLEMRGAFHRGLVFHSVRQNQIRSEPGPEPERSFQFMVDYERTVLKTRRNVFRLHPV